MPWKKSEPMDQRREFALKALGTLNFRALCQEYGISAKTGYKWRERFLRQGLEGMEEESRRPHQALGMRCPAELYRGLEQALPRTRSAIELSRDGETLGGQKRQAQLEEPKDIPHREPGGLGGRAPKDGKGPTGDLVWPTPARTP